METIERDYAPGGVRFYYVYKALAHPGLNGFVSPFTLEERLMHVHEAQRRLGTRFTWLCDTMDNDLKHALGDQPNSEFVIDPEGRVVRKRAWSNPEQLRADLVALIGPVASPTRVADLDLPALEITRPVGGDAVERLKLPGGMRPLKVEPVLEKDGAAFFVKLRAEGDAGLLGEGRGKLYLGFFLDPLYAVHWNNQVAPLRFELEVPAEAVASPPSGTAPQPSIPQDKDPREFLVEANVPQRAAPLELTVHYMACDDAETFCTAVTQRYRIHLQGDPDGGSRRVPGGRQRPGGFVGRLLGYDRNGDGKVAQEEVPDFLERFFSRMDANGDGFLDRQEIQRGADRFRRTGDSPQSPRSRGEGRGDQGFRPRSEE